MDKIVLIGYGGHSRSLADSIEKSGQYIIDGYVDPIDALDNKYAYLGTDDDLVKIYEGGIHYAVIGLGQIKCSDKRRQIYTKLKSIGFELPIIIDPSAIVAKNVSIGEGTFIGKGAIINCGVSIGTCCIVNTGALCEHDDDIGDFTHVAVRVTCCGNVSVGNDCLIGANATIIQGISVGNNSIVGAGSVVIHDVASNSKVAGIPASELRGTNE